MMMRAWAIIVMHHSIFVYKAYGPSNPLFRQITFLNERENEFVCLTEMEKHLKRDILH